VKNNLIAVGLFSLVPRDWALLRATPSTPSQPYRMTLRTIQQGTLVRPRVVSLARARAKTSPTPGRSFGLRRYALRLRCEDDYRPRERARSECAGEAHDRGYRRVEVQSVRSTGRLEWEVTLQGRDKSGRDVRIRCQYDARTRRARLNLSAQDALPSLYTIAPETEQFPVRYAGNCATF